MDLNAKKTVFVVNPHILVGYFKACIWGRTIEAVQFPSPMFWYGFHADSHAAKCGNIFSSIIFFVTIVITGGMSW